MIEEILEQVSPKTLILAVVGALFLLKTAEWINRERKIRALGGRTRRNPTWYPFDLDIIARAVYATTHYKDYQLWTRWFTTPKGMNYTFEAAPLGRRMILTAEPENIKAILATQFTDYGKGEPFHREWKAFLGDSIFTTDLDQWHNSRQLIRPQFIKDRVSDLDVFETHVQILMDQMTKLGREEDGTQGKEFDLSDLFFRYTLDAATHFLLGRSVDSLVIQEQDFADAFGEVQRIQNMLARAGPVNKLIPRTTFKKHLKVIDDFVNTFVDDTLRLTPEELSTKSKSEDGYNFLHALAGFTRDRQVLRDQLVAVLLAGRDTTASTLSWTFYELAKKPEIYQKLRNVIIDRVGLDRAPTYEDLKNMKYLQNVMNETLRLYPVVPYNVRLALKDTTLPVGGGPDGLSPIGILKDQIVSYSALVMQRRADLTPDVLNFSPERWETWQPKPWNYIPFNGGPRICIGQQFALTEMAYTIVRLLQRFERMENHMGPVDGGDPCLQAEIVLRPGQGVKVAFFEKEGEK
ncbi:Cytochrome P450 52A1 [Lachnellula suecica]|uniref:Cytochrome P450 52A1 n=1 Tax=Lachnellula suecica TaxID=602035 RepID=A0A8T9CK38_9HELO|nr:Cytochrome P450 52A1 [Lachnellula suecica]